MPVDAAVNPLGESPPTRAHDGRTMIGHVVVAHALAGEPGESVALWHLDTRGASTGAWVTPVRVSDADPVAARRLLQLCLCRSVVAWCPDEATTVLSALADAANVTTADWRGSAIALPDAIQELALTRTACEKRTNDERAVKKHTTSIEWPVDVPDPLPATIEGLLTITRYAVPPSGPAAEAALGTSAVVRWSVRRWGETMAAVRRREYLRRDLGPVRHLPPVWETRLADAYARNDVLRDRG